MPTLIRPRRRQLVAFFVAAAVAALGISSTVGAVSAVPITPAVTNNPEVISGTRDLPTDVRGSSTYGTVASLGIPAGVWIITAKGYLESTTDAVVTCQLVAGSDVHTMTTGLEQNAHGAGQWQSIELVIPHAFGSPGAAALRCQSDAQTGDVLMRFIRITAMKVSKLTEKVNGGLTAIYGSGKPEATVFGKDAEVQLDGGNVLRDVATLGLQAGLWWITAVASVGTTGVGHITCRLATSVDYDESTATTGGQDDHVPMNVQVTHRFPTDGTVTLRCSAADDLFVSNYRIVAVRAGHLVNRQVGGAEYNYGTGTPQIYSAFRDDGGTFGSTATTIASLVLPAGSWMLAAKLYVDPGINGGFHVLCKLAAGARVDQVDTVTYQSHRSIITLLGARALGATGGTVRLACQSAPNVPAHAYWIKLTAIQASTLTQKPI
jgi:hypothetical protein